ncbi:MAG: hypothetical protein FWE22_03985 [Firmicutes bacterium]|nr:hypothetical protein [Bacillota bacterium]
MAFLTLLLKENRKLPATTNLPTQASSGQARQNGLAFMPPLSCLPAACGGRLSSKRENEVL